MTQGLNLDVAQGMASTNSIAEVIADMETVLRKITADADEALALWKGQASQSFTQVVTEWKAEADQLNRALDELKQSLVTGFNGYDASDSENASDYRAMAGGGLNLG